MSKVMRTMDGNGAAAHIAYAFTDVAAIYPITPSSNMAENVDEMASKGQKNLFGQVVKVAEMQSEAGAAGAVHGSLASGALTTTFTASQGLLLMIPNMYKIAGELLPGVIHCSARALASHALSIFGDHSDVMACRQTGFAMFASGGVQEVMDLAGVAHLAAIKGRVPFLHFFDGFRTSHELQKIEVMDYADLEKLLDKDAVAAFRANALNPEHPVTRGTAQNPDVFFQAREASNKFYNALPAIVEDYMGEISKITGREYHLFNYYGAPDAEHVIVAMGSVTETIEETIDYMAKQGLKVGLVKVHLYRPFDTAFLRKTIPATAKVVTVLDRTKEPGAEGEPLYLDVCGAFNGVENAPVIVGGRYGLGSKDTTPDQIIAVYDNMNKAEPKNHFTIGINDDVTHLSLPTAGFVNTIPADTVSCKFWGLGSDGTVGANKNSIKIIGDHTDKYAQAYFAYDSKKSFGVTISHLRFGDSPIRATYLISKADFVSCSQPSYMDKYEIISDVKPGGTFLLNCEWTGEELDKHLPGQVKRYIAENNVQFYTVDATKLAVKVGLGPTRTNTVLQAAFFKLSGIIPEADAVKYMKEYVAKTFSKKGEAVVNMNCAAIDEGVANLVKVDVPASWKDCPDDELKLDNVPAFVNDIMIPMNRQQGGDLPVSAFEGREDGTFPAGTAAYEKRGFAVVVPKWIPSNCIQCNQCATVCPHATIRPYLLTEDEAAKIDGETADVKGKKDTGLKFRMQVDVLDCTGCGNCAQVCPAKEKALVMVPAEQETKEIANWETCVNLPERPELFDKTTIKGSQFAMPYLEFSGACAGCGETPYAKLITQLFGDRMMIANATGCSSIWAGSAPSTPYTKDKNGRGPAWANSLFEDNAEYGYGMLLGTKQRREKVAAMALALKDATASEGLKAAIDSWLNNMNNGNASKAASAELVAQLEAEGSDAAKELLASKDDFVKKSQWIFGGDGWAYDIGYGGVDHVLASGEDVNIFVFDTEVYSNTGGQASKSTPAGAVAKFAASGKVTKKKDLGMMAMSYGYVYVAQVAMGANMQQTLKAIAEAEAYHGPSLIIAYAPCINHGLKAGMGCAQAEIKRAVEAGYWQMYRYNPDLKEQGKNPFILDSKDPVSSFRDFIVGENRYSSLLRAFPDKAAELFAKNEEYAKERLEGYKKLANQDK